MMLMKNFTGTTKQLDGVSIMVFIDEDGNVVSASPTAGEEKLFEKAVKMALRAKFTPTLLSDIPVKVTGNIVYNFAP